MWEQTLRYGNQQSTSGVYASKGNMRNLISAVFAAASDQQGCDAGKVVTYLVDELEAFRKQH